MNKQLSTYLLLLCVAISSWGCEDIIDVDLDQGLPQLTVDAWIDVMPQKQNIRLTISGAYFSNTPNDAALGAAVTVTNLTSDSTFTFVDQGDGNYTYDGTQQVLGSVGDQFRLELDFDGQQFSAATEVYAAPPIDSLIWKYEEESLLGPEGHYIELFARDLPGQGNAYWIKTFKNGNYINDPSYLNYAYDGAFDPGFDSDGITFITPIRFGLVNYINLDEPDIPPYQIGDIGRVEIHGIHLEARNFLVELQEQTTNGGLFATPAYNISTNISNTDATSEVIALGFFNVASISSAEVIVGQ